MNILFIENRQRTYFWDIIAKELAKEGHNTFFIVQNIFYKPKKNSFKFIPYPKKSSLKHIDKLPCFDKIKQSDRANKHYGLNSTAHYSYYYTNINKIIDEFIPDLVIGESTAFHELLTIEICKNKNILYLHPSPCRYPTNRFSFYKYDTLNPYHGSNETLDEEIAKQMIKNIVERNTVPDYMKKNKKNKKALFKEKLELIKLFISYFVGEHYNTPSLIIRRQNEKKRKQNIIKWDAVAKQRQHLLNNNFFKILYPLQIQPEANLDVWGRKFNDQLNVIKNIVNNTSEDIQIIVKPNPKSKYELSDSLINYVKNEDRIIIVPHSSKMEEVFNLSDLIITVTGTIALESILANKPVVNLIKTINNEASNIIYLENIEKLQEVVETIKNGLFPKAQKKEIINFFNRLNQTSYEGRTSIVHDYSQDINIPKIGFMDVIENLKNNG